MRQVILVGFQAPYLSVQGGDRALEVLDLRFFEGEVVMTWEEIWELLEITDMEVPGEEEPGAVCNEDLKALPVEFEYG